SDGSKNAVVELLDRHGITQPVSARLDEEEVSAVRLGTVRTIVLDGGHISEGINEEFRQVEVLCGAGGKASNTRTHPPFFCYGAGIEERGISKITTGEKVGGAICVTQNAAYSDVEFLLKHGI